MNLGFAPIRDAFADYFFPGTSTIQTRARYFLFVPWIMSLLRIRRKLSVQSEPEVPNAGDEAHQLSSGGLRGPDWHHRPRGEVTCDECRAASTGVDCTSGALGRFWIDRPVLPAFVAQIVTAQRHRY